MAFIEWFRELSYGILDLCMPVSCICCGSNVETVQQKLPICRDCSDNLPTMDGTVCYLCAKPMGSDPPPEHSAPSAFVCGQCRTETPILKRTLAGFRYEGTIRLVIQDWKFGGHPEWGPWLVKNLTKQLPGEEINDWDGLVPIPLRPERKHERGFNQAEQLARGLGEEYSIPVLDKIIKIRSTKPQAQLKRDERIDNLNGVFDVKDPPELSGRSILLVDDIFTTGSTLNSAGDVLRTIGVERIGAVVLARAT